MTLKIHQIMAVHKALSELTRSDLPVHVAFRLARFLEKTGPDLEQAEKQRVRLAEQSGATKNEEGVHQIPAEKQQWFVDELNKLLNEEVEVDVEKIPLSTLANVNCKITDVIGLSILFDDTK